MKKILSKIIKYTIWNKYIYNICNGCVTYIKGSRVLLDTYEKNECYVDCKYKRIKIGNKMEIYHAGYKNNDSIILLNSNMTLIEKKWEKLSLLYKNGESIKGKIINKINKGGFAVLIDDVLAFLPLSQIKVDELKNMDKILESDEYFKILKIDRQYGNIIVSHKIASDEQKKINKNDKLVINEGAKVTGVVKNITTYGAFLDLGNIDGLLHITDICWGKISHPSEKLTIGQSVQVIVLKYDISNHRISLGLKQLSKNPWLKIEEKYSIGDKCMCKIIEISEYGVIVELEKYIEGIVYINEIDWNNTKPCNVFKIGDLVEAIILDINREKCRINLSIKKCKENPYRIFSKKYSINSIITGTVYSIKKNNIIARTNDDLNTDIIIPNQEMSYYSSNIIVKNNDNIKAVILEINLKTKYIVASIRRLQERDYKKDINELLRSKSITCLINNISAGILHVKIKKNIIGVIRDQNVCYKRDKSLIGKNIEAKALGFDKNNKILILSRRLIEIEEEKRILNKYQAVSTNIKMGDVLKIAINNL